MVPPRNSFITFSMHAYWASNHLKLTLAFTPILTSVLGVWLCTIHMGMLLLYIIHGLYSPWTLPMCNLKYTQTCVLPRMGVCLLSNLTFFKLNFNSTFILLKDILVILPHTWSYCNISNQTSCLTIYRLMTSNSY